jgi:hypothetical protein
VISQLMRLLNGKMEKWKIPILQLQHWDPSSDFAINASSLTHTPPSRPVLPLCSPSAPLSARAAGGRASARLKWKMEKWKIPILQFRCDFAINASSRRR